MIPLSTHEPADPRPEIRNNGSEGRQGRYEWAEPLVPSFLDVGEKVLLKEVVRAVEANVSNRALLPQEAIEAGKLHLVLIGPQHTPQVIKVAGYPMIR
jgi:hypothetical protein